jgi:RNA polymerase sigma-70 factor (ECF subfamily)
MTLFRGLPLLEPAVFPATGGWPRVAANRAGVEGRTRLRADDFGRAVGPHLRLLLAKARRLLGSEDQAWDAVQETLLSLWKEEEQPANLPAWLLRTVTHRSLHALRTRSRRRKHEERAADQQPEASRHDDPARLAQLNELRLRIEATLGGLTREHREVFQLREVDRLDYETIADLLDIPVGTVRSRLNRSRLACKEALKGIED